MQIFKNSWNFWSCFIILAGNNGGGRNSARTSGRDRSDAFKNQQMEDCFASVESKLHEVFNYFLSASVLGI